MHRTSMKPRALACSLMAGSLLVLGACAERDADDALTTTTDTDATTPVATVPQVPQEQSGQMQSGQAQPGLMQPGATRPGQMQPGQMAGSGEITDADREFLAVALATNQHETEAVQLGMERAESPEVKAYVAQLERDHQQLGQRIAPLAQQAGVSAASSDVAMPLPQGTGEDFDRAFMEMMVADHERAIADFERAANDPSHSAQVRAVAREALSSLRQHLQQAQSLSQQLVADTSVD